MTMRVIGTLYFITAGVCLLFAFTLFKVVLVVFPETPIYLFPAWLLGSSVVGMLFACFAWYVAGCHVGIPQALKQSPLLRLFDKLVEICRKDMNGKISNPIEVYISLLLAWGFFVELPITCAVFCFLMVKDSKGLVK